MRPLYYAINLALSMSTAALLSASALPAAPALLRLNVAVRMQRPGIRKRTRSAMILIGILPAIA